MDLTTTVKTVPKWESSMGKTCQPSSPRKPERSKKKSVLQVHFPSLTHNILSTCPSLQERFYTLVESPSFASLRLPWLFFSSTCLPSTRLLRFTSCCSFFPSLPSRTRPLSNQSDSSQVGQSSRPISKIRVSSMWTTCGTHSLALMATPRASISRYVGDASDDCTSTIANMHLV